MLSTQLVLAGILDQLLLVDAPPTHLLTSTNIYNYIHSPVYYAIMLIIHEAERRVVLFI